MNIKNTNRRTRLTQAAWKYKPADGSDPFNKLELIFYIGKSQYVVEFGIDDQDDPKYRYAIQLLVFEDDADVDLLKRIDTFPGITMIIGFDEALDEDLYQMQWNADSIQKVFKPIQKYVSIPSEEDLKKLPEYQNINQSKRQMSIIKKKQLVKLLKEYNQSKRVLIQQEQQEQRDIVQLFNSAKPGLGNYKQVVAKIKDMVNTFIDDEDGEPLSKSQIIEIQNAYKFDISSGNMLSFDAWGEQQIDTNVDGIFDTNNWDYDTSTWMDVALNQGEPYDSSQTAAGKKKGLSKSKNAYNKYGANMFFVKLEKVLSNLETKKGVRFGQLEYWNNY